MAEEFRPRVLVAEKIAPEGIEMLSRQFEAEVHDKISREELLEKISDFDALIVRSGTKVDREVLEKANRLKVIGRAGIGIDNIDVEFATKRGILVANVPESNTISAAEHTMALLLACARNIPAACASLERGEWKRSDYQGVELYGKTLGIIGLGRIGALVAERAKAFGMKVIAHDPFVSEQRGKQMGVELIRDLDELLRRSDFITLHVPQTQETYHMIGEKQFEVMKDNAIIINASRGGVIEEKALADAIRRGKIKGAAIDVFESEPPNKSELLSIPQVIETPHLGASTAEAQYKAGIAIAEQIIAGLTGDFVSGVVNVSMPQKEVVEVLKPFLPLVEKLGRLLNQLIQSTVSEVQIEVVGEISKYDTSLLTAVLLKGFLEGISTEPVSYINARIIATERGIEVKEAKTSQSRDYLNLIVATASNKGKKMSAGATLVERNQELFVDVLDFQITIPPSKYMGFVTYEDKPGMIGRVGTILGEYGVNIASLEVGRKRMRGLAAMGLSLDNPVEPEVIERLKGEKGIKEVAFPVF